MLIKPRSILAGIRSYLPFSLLPKSGTGGTNSAQYCYLVWMRHLVHLHRVKPGMPFQCVAELGPGDSIGVGIAALLSGADQYVALDAQVYANIEANLAIFDDLVALFKKRAAIPDNEAFPGATLELDTYSFPTHILSEKALAAALTEERLTRIRESIINNCDMIRYQAPWDAPDIIRDGTVDIILSQAVMEHANNIPMAYAAMRRWIKPEGLMSHVIDFRCHGISKTWNAHWGCGDLLWKVVYGNRPFFLNRHACGEHIDELEKNNFSHILIKRNHANNGLSRSQLAPRFQRLSDDDLSTDWAHIISAPVV